jgi:hypothetical protein
MTIAINEPRRGAIALAICVGSALCGTVAILKGWHTFQVSFWVWFAWRQTAGWLERGHLFDDVDRRLWRKTMGQIYQEAKRGTLPSQAPFSSPIAKVINLCSRLMFLMLLVAIIWFFVK